MKNKTIFFGLILLFVMINLTSCAPSGYESGEAGFFSGIWHGLIIVFSLIGKIFGSDIGMYAENNTGFLYWVGYIFGVVGLGGGAVFFK